MLIAVLQDATVLPLALETVFRLTGVVPKKPTFALVDVPSFAEVTTFRLVI